MTGDPRWLREAIGMAWQCNPNPQYSRTAPRPEVAARIRAALPAIETGLREQFDREIEALRDVAMQHASWSTRTSTQTLRPTWNCECGAFLADDWQGINSITAALAAHQLDMMRAVSS